MSTYFITGGYGFLGQYIVQAVHDYDAAGELRVLVRRQRQTRLNLDKLERINWTRGELTDPASFAEQLKGVARMQRPAVHALRGGFALRRGPQPCPGGSAPRPVLARDATALRETRGPFPAGMVERARQPPPSHARARRTLG